MDNAVPLVVRRSHRCEDDERSGRDVGCPVGVCRRLLSDQVGTCRDVVERCKTASISGFGADDLAQTVFRDVCETRLGLLQLSCFSEVSFLAQVVVQLAQGELCARQRLTINVLHCGAIRVRVTVSLCADLLVDLDADVCLVDVCEALCACHRSEYGASGAGECETCCQGNSSSLLSEVGCHVCLPFRDCSFRPPSCPADGRVFHGISPSRERFPCNTPTWIGSRTRQGAFLARPWRTAQLSGSSMNSRSNLRV